MRVISLLFVFIFRLRVINGLYVCTFFRGSRFLIMAPDAWHIQALERGYVLLGDLKVGVHPYAPDLDIGQLSGLGLGCVF
jgi:hypothetical protein